MNQIKVIPAITEILLHRGNMLLLDRIIDFDEEFAIAEYKPVAGAWYADRMGNMPAWVGIELMAQTISAHAGLLKYGGNAPLKQGALLGTRRYQATTPAFGVNQAINIQVSLLYRDESGLAAYDCVIYDKNYIPHNSHNNILATATLKVYEPDDFQQFLQGNSL